LFNNPTLSDVKIKQIFKSQVREYYAHKAILCMESEYFMNMFAGGFKEAVEGSIELHEDDPDHFSSVLKFLYGGEFD
ncbi:hypothetical protein CC86DRAFT_263419, partial [Ophiobolus disseminans]